MQANYSIDLGIYSGVGSIFLHIYTSACLGGGSKKLSLGLSNLFSNLVARVLHVIIFNYCVVSDKIAVKNVIFNES